MTRPRRQQRGEPVAVVTGAAGRIGSAIVERLARHFLVVATDLRAIRAAERVLGWRMDVTSEAAVRAVRDRLYREHGRADVLVNCAGVLRTGPFLASRDADFRACWEVNVAGAARCMRLLGELMARRRSGRIINIGSVGGARAFPGAAPYAASKAGLRSLTQTAARELAPLGIRVVGVSPGVVRSSLGTIPRELVDAIPLGRIAEPDEVAEAVEFLATCQTNYLTGSELVIDGGLSA